MFFSIALHQPAESIALLVSFLRSNFTSKQIIRYLSIYSIVGIIGIYFGMLVSNLASTIIEAIFIAITAGTFVYVGATEVKYIKDLNTTNQTFHLLLL
jgi:zinc transporter 1/2/3